MENQKEIWKDVVDYEGLYQVSNFGNIKSLKNGKYIILKTGVNSSGYLNVNLWKNKIHKNRLVHQLVAQSFLNHVPCGFNLVVNHKNFNKQNNHVDNLEIVTNRENTNLKHIKSSSQHVGVCWHKARNKWLASITINGKSKYLGRFDDELEASNAYNDALKIINKKELPKIIEKENNQKEKIKCPF